MSKEIEMLNWSEWQSIPQPAKCRSINAPSGPGVYQIRDSKNKQLIQFGIGKKCQKRMKSIFPKPHGTGTRNNENKRNFILENWARLEYRTLATDSREEAYNIERRIKSLKNHLFNS